MYEISCDVDVVAPKKGNDDAPQVALVTVRALQFGNSQAKTWGKVTSTPTNDLFSDLPLETGYS